MKIRAVIIDDKQGDIDELVMLTKQSCPRVQIVATANDADGGIGIILEHDPEIVFLDIEMPGKSGFDLLKSFGKYFFEVILMAGVDGYGIQAVKFGAVGYLLKPFDPAELTLGVQNAIERSFQKLKSRELGDIVQRIQRENQTRGDRHLLLRARKRSRFVSIKEIIFCESINSYTRFSLTGKETILVSRPIYEYEAMLQDYGFIRCHQSYLVNKRFIRGWEEDDTDFLLLAEGVKVPVSRNKKEVVKEELGRVFDFLEREM